MADSRGFRRELGVVTGIECGVEGAHTAVARFARRAVASRRLVAMMLALLSMSCAPTEGPESGLKAFYADIENGAYADAANIVRAQDGAPLADSDRQTLIDAWRNAYGPSGRLVHVTQVRVIGSRDLPVASLSAVGAMPVRQLTFEADGTSETPCFHLPLTQATVRVALIAQRWYLTQDDFGSLLPHCRIP